MNISISRGGIATSAVLLAFATAPLIGQSPPNSTKPQDRAQQGSNAQGQKGQHVQQGQEGLEQIGNAYKELHQVTLRTLQAQANNWQEKPTGKSNSDWQDKSKDKSNNDWQDKSKDKSNNDWQDKSKDKSSDWQDKSDDKSSQSNRGAFSSSTTSQTLRAEELLIAGCSEGLLAGAPNGSSSNRDARKSATLPTGDSKSDTKQGPQSNPDRHSQAAGSEGQSVGMILVSANSSSSSSFGQKSSDPMSEKQDRDSFGDRDTFGDRDSNTRNASGVFSAGALKPGVYCVKQSGSSVWLTDQEGQIVLRTSLDSQHGNKSPKSSEFGGKDRDSEFGRKDRGSDFGGKDRDSGFGSNRGSNFASQSDWEHVFAAIAEEAMNSMGWAKQGSLASMR